jgi:hypothetical protein
LPQEEHQALIQLHTQSMIIRQTLNLPRSQLSARRAIPERIGRAQIRIGQLASIFRVHEVAG